MERILAIREQIQRRREEFELQLQKAVADWDHLIEAGAPEPELRKQLKRISTVLSESSYIQNLEEEVENLNHA